jgi:putative heme-binding domain-containing protein
VDGDQGVAYAWLAFGRFAPEVISVPASRDQQRRRIAAAAEIVESMRLTDLHEPIAALLKSSASDVPSRAAAAKALLALNVASSMPTLLATLKDASAPDALREAIATAVSQSDSAEVRKTFVELMQTAPNRLQRSIAMALASTKAGSEALLTAVAEGKASPRLLQSQSVLSRLKTSAPGNLDQRIEQLTRNLPEADLELQKLIDQRSAAFNVSTASAERGKAVYTQNCAVCHQLGGEGAKVGPQLDGVGKRGVARLAEDILDSNRNVDVAFRSTTFVLDKADPIDGIVRAEQGESFIVVDSQGKEHVLAKAQIKKRIDSKLSLMPSNFHELLKPQEFDDLLAFLMSK